MAKLPTLYAATWQNIIEARPDFKGLNLKAIWGRDVIGEATRSFDIDKVLIASLMKAMNWHPDAGHLAGGISKRATGNGEGYYNSVISNINGDGLQSFYEFAINSSWTPSLATMEAELTDDEITYLASSHTAIQPAPAQWGTW